MCACDPKKKRMSDALCIPSSAGMNGQEGHGYAGENIVGCGEMNGGDRRGGGGMIHDLVTPSHPQQQQHAMQGHISQDNYSWQQQQPQQQQQHNSCRVEQRQHNSYATSPKVRGYLFICLFFVYLCVYRHLKPKCR